MEERTGYGGGFNERAGVEYRRREDSDDEYDQYGRKKKKKAKLQVSEGYFCKMYKKCYCRVSY